ncbi:hypothetical protein BE17_16970 [Sorangium cellulosum]|uniref:Uncharacterized protein n=1 Tax=Sorangium cellulosum TaxID=56 RepID=A0A150SPU4_SORCE|nr:hypothetical protein BE17_16970 [Sorangium cellulosum]
MGVELRVTFDGDEPGLAQHRLSLSSFGDPLKLLLSALQRTASGILASALDDTEYGTRGGRLAAEAKLLDLELASIEQGSAAPTFVCVARPGSQLPLESFNTLGEQTVQRLVQDLDAERQGRPANAAVRRYLRSLPAGVRAQRYTAWVDGAVLADVQFGELSLAEVPAQAARLVKLLGHVVSVGFDPGASYVTLKTSSRTVRCSASSEQVERALPLRHKDVVAAVLDGQKPALVWILDAAAPPPHVPIEGTLEHLRTSWAETMRILAQ